MAGLAALGRGHVGSRGHFQVGAGAARGGTLGGTGARLDRPCGRDCRALHAGAIVLDQGEGDCTGHYGDLFPDSQSDLCFRRNLLDRAGGNDGEALPACDSAGNRPDADHPSAARGASVGRKVWGGISGVSAAHVVLGTLGADSSLDCQLFRSPQAVRRCQQTCIDPSFARDDSPVRLTFRNTDANLWVCASCRLPRGCLRGGRGRPPNRRRGRRRYLPDCYHFCK